jgi:hypothetical protein
MKGSKQTNKEAKQKQRQTNKTNQQPPSKKPHIFLVAEKCIFPNSFFLPWLLWEQLQEDGVASSSLWYSKGLREGQLRQSG